MLDLNFIEAELKKRLEYPYYWGIVQYDHADRRTSFVYKTHTFEALLTQANKLDQPLRNYAYNRWLNFWSAQAVEQLFKNHPTAIPNDNPYDKCIDFYIKGIPFDHKTSVFPKSFNRSLEYALKNKTELIRWLYQNQSQQQRKHYKNRIFAILYHTNPSQAHWKLKAEISLIGQKIEKYLSTFDKQNLIITDFENTSVYSDIIWVIH